MPQDIVIPDTELNAAVVVGGSAACGVILLCDHASNRLPVEYGTLGLPEAEFARHIAYDIGAENVTRTMAAQLGCPAVLSRFSRLLIDPNRGIDDPTLIMRLSDGAIVPGNRNLDASERERRIMNYHTPYHAAITGVIDTYLAGGLVPSLLSIHSFTPVWKGAVRPWHASVLWDKDPRLALPLLAALRAEPGLVVGDNEPYSGVLRGDTLWLHGSQRGIAHAIVEVRQDLVAEKAGQILWADRLAGIVTGLIAGPSGAGLRRLEHFGSLADMG